MKTRQLSAGDLMSTNVTKVSLHTPLDSLLKISSDAECAYAVVMDARGTPVGVNSLLDLRVLSGSLAE